MYSENINNNEQKIWYNLPCNICALSSLLACVYSHTQNHFKSTLSIVVVDASRRVFVPLSVCNGFFRQRRRCPSIHRFSSTVTMTAYAVCANCVFLGAQSLWLHGKLFHSQNELKAIKMWMCTLSAWRRHSPSPISLSSWQNHFQSEKYFHHRRCHRRLHRRRRIVSSLSGFVSIIFARTISHVSHRRRDGIVITIIIVRREFNKNKTSQSKGNLKSNLVLVAQTNCHAFFLAVFFPPHSHFFPRFAFYVFLITDQVIEFNFNSCHAIKSNSADKYDKIDVGLNITRTHTHEPKPKNSSTTTTTKKTVKTSVLSHSVHQNFMR